MLMCRLTIRVAIALVAAVLPISAAAQAPPGQPPPSQPPTVGQIAPPASGAPLTLQDALMQARVNSQQFRSAQLAADLASQDRKIARAALLPTLNGWSQFIYTEPNGTNSGVWLPNDGPKVYADWLNVHGDMSL